MDRSHSFWMQQALAQAEQAMALDEVPVGAVLVRDDCVVASGFNQPVSSHDPTGHAEIVTLRRAAQEALNYRLPGTTLYVTIEPCTMCVGALVHARVEKLVFGAPEPRAGAVISKDNLLDRDYFNHRIDYEHGILASRCAELMQQFFRQRRNAT